MVAAHLVMHYNPSPFEGHGLSFCEDVHIYGTILHLTVLRSISLECCCLIKQSVFTPIAAVPLMFSTWSFFASFVDLTRIDLMSVSK